MSIKMAFYLKSFCNENDGIEEEICLVLLKHHGKLQTCDACCPTLSKLTMVAPAKLPVKPALQLVADAYFLLQSANSLQKMF
jgi:hypothetical protein